MAKITKDMGSFVSAEHIPTSALEKRQKKVPQSNRRITGQWNDNQLQYHQGMEDPERYWNECRQKPPQPDGPLGLPEEEEKPPRPHWFLRFLEGLGQTSTPHYHLFP